jgi:hypothetical protein
MDLPVPWQLAACLALLLRAGRPTEGIVGALATRPSLSIGLIRDLARQPAHRSMAVRLFEALLQADRRDEPIERLLGLGRAIPPEVLGPCLKIALERGRVDVADVVRDHGTEFLSRPGGANVQVPIVDWLLENPRDEAWTEPDVLEFLEEVGANPPWPPGDGGRRLAMLRLAIYRVKPTLIAADLADLSEQLDRLDGPDRDAIEAGILAAVVRALDDLPEENDPKEAAEAVLAGFSRGGKWGLADVYPWLIRGLEAARGNGKRPDVLTAMVAAGLGVFRLPELAERYAAAAPDCGDVLQRSVHDLVWEGAPRGSAKILKQLDEDSVKWPEAARKRWEAVRKGPRPSPRKMQWKDFLPRIRRDPKAAGYLRLGHSVSDPPANEDRPR